MKYLLSCLMVAFATLSCIKEGPVLAPAMSHFEISGHITQEVTGLPVTHGQCTVRLVRKAYYSDNVAEAFTDASGHYALKFSSNLAYDNYYLEVVQNETLFQNSWGYWPYFEAVPIKSGTRQKLDFEIETHGVLRASFQKRGAAPVSSLSLVFDGLTIGLPLNPSSEQYYTLRGNHTNRILCNYRVNGVNYTDTLSFYVNAFDTIQQVIEYGRH